MEPFHSIYELFITHSSVGVNRKFKKIKIFSKFSVRLGEFTCSEFCLNYNLFFSECKQEFFDTQQPAVTIIL
jgi:hypothetical protein